MKTREGFAYIALLASLAVLMLALTAASENIAQSVKREKELQLFFVGEQFQNAIASYYQNSPNGTQQFPSNLEELLTDNRSIKPMRHLRRIYLDPMTNQSSWGLVKNKQKKVIGVYSLSSGQLIKTNISPALVTLKKGQTLYRYSDLKFIYIPNEIGDEFNYGDDIDDNFLSNKRR